MPSVQALAMALVATVVVAVAHLDVHTVVSAVVSAVVTAGANTLVAMPVKILALNAALGNALVHFLVYSPRGERYSITFETK